MRRLQFAAVCSIFWLWTVPVHAATVAIVRPSPSSPELNQTLVLLQGELLSVGLEVKLVDAPPTSGRGSSELHAWLAGLASKDGVDAVVQVVGDRGAIGVDVWVANTKPADFELARVILEPKAGNPSEKLAIRALEVLRSRFLEIDLNAKGRQGETEARPSIAEASGGEVNAAANPPRRIGIEAGAVVLTSLNGIGPAILPIVRLDWAARPWLVLQAALAGLGTRPTVTAEAGHARVAQQYGLLGGGYRLRSAQRLRPFLALSSGVLRTSIEAEPGATKEGHSAQRWSFLLDGSLGAELRLGDRYAVTVAAHVQMAEPYVAIHFVDEVVASSGRPNLLLSMTIGAWL